MIGIVYFVVQGEILKEDGEKNLGNHDSELKQPGSDSVCSPESVWEDSEEVIPTFFSAMSARYSRPFKLPGNQTPVSLLRNQLWWHIWIMRVDYLQIIMLMDCFIIEK